MVCLILIKIVFLNVTSFLPIQHKASFLMATLLGLLRPEHGGITIFRNLMQYSPKRHHTAENFFSSTALGTSDFAQKSYHYYVLKRNLIYLKFQNIRFTSPIFELNISSLFV